MVLFELDAVAVGEGSDHIVDIGLDLEEVGHYLITVVILEVLCGLAFRPVVLLRSVRPDDLSAEEFEIIGLLVGVLDLAAEVSGGECLYAVDGQAVLELEGPVLRFGIRGDVLARAFPEFPAERTAQVNGCLAVHLACEDVADGIEHHVGILLSVIPHQLALVLGSQDHGNLVGTGGVHQVVQTFHEDCRKLVQQDSAVQLAGLVDGLAEA